MPAQSLRKKDPKVRTNNIAMVVPQRFITLDLPFLRKCMGGICTMADQRGYDMLLCYASSTEYTQRSVSWRAIRWTVLF